MSVLGAQTFQVQKWPAGGFHSDATRRRAHAPAPAHPGARRRHPGAGQDRRSGGVGALGLRLRRRVPGRDHQPERLDRRRHARVPAEQHPLCRAWGGTSRQMDVRERRATWPSSAMRSARSCSRSSTRSGGRSAWTGASTTSIGVFDEKKSAFGGNFDNYVLIPVTTFVTPTAWWTATASRARSTSRCARRRPAARPTTPSRRRARCCGASGA